MCLHSYINLMKKFRCIKRLPVFFSGVQDDSSLSSEEEAEMSEPTWLAADLGAVSDLSPASRGERMRHSPQTAHGKDDDGKKPETDARCRLREA